MKVMVGIPCLMTGGTEIQTLNLVRALVAAGHEVVTVCYFEHSTAMVRNYEMAGSRVVLMSQDGERPIGVKNTSMALFKGFRRILQMEHPDVAHVQYMAPGAIPIMILWLLGVKRIVATAHTAADIYPSLGLLHFVSRYMLTAFQCITLRAEESFFGTSRLYSPEIKLSRRSNHFTIYNNLPPYITISDHAKVHSKPLTIGVVSRLEPIKGMDLVVPAFAEVHARYADTRLLVVGDGSQRQLMEQQAEEAGVGQVVNFVGQQEQSVLQGFYDQIDILLMPSRSEGFGLTAIEGMARGCVVVAAATGGLPEVVRDGEVGLLHKPESATDIADKVCSLVADRNMLQMLSRNAIRHVSQYSFACYAQMIQDLYEKIAALRRNNI